LYSLFHFLNPAMFGTIERFNEDYGIPIQKNSDKEATRSLKSKISPFILRRLKQDVLTDLPDRMDQILYVEMEGYHKEYYESRRKYYKAMIDSSISTEGIEKSQFLMFQAFNELRQIASIPEAVTDGKIESGKVPVLMERIEELVMSGHKIAVFFNYLAGIELVEAELESAGIGYVTMTGATGDRERVVRRFQEDSQTKVMLMTLKTGGVGLNLTAADCAFIFEPWWNKAAEEQAIGRLHRIGQTSKVLSFQMITLGTIEEKIMELQQKKKDLVDALISSDKSMSKFLSREDIDFILG
ncbi:MAG: DEAD/DEAH box helicase, partial [Bacteroidales bacterium]|nr:DEAD/DEAH box helicase [Bacteroidales bacterium]